MPISVIPDIVAALKARMPAGFPIFFGSDHLFKHSRPPRIVLVPTTEKFGPPMQGRDKQGRPLKPILTRSITLDAYFWGQDQAETEGMLLDFLRATHREAATSYTPGVGEWLDKAQLGGFLTAGDLYRLPLTFDTPIVPAERWAVLETIALEYELTT